MPDPSGNRRESWVAGIRRGAWAYIGGTMMLLLAIPAIADMRSLLVVLGIALLVLGALVTVATVVSGARRGEAE